MKFTIIHPTARLKPTGSFPLGWLGACQQWLHRCANPSHVEYILVVDAAQVGLLNYSIAASGLSWPPPWGLFSVVANHGRECFVDARNAGFQAATGEILINSSDDVFAPQDWDRVLSELCPDTSELVGFDCPTGSPRDGELFAVQILTKTLSDLIGPSSPEYWSMFCDDEWTLQMKRLGRIVQGPRFEHRHPSLGTAANDEVYEKENAAWAYRKGRKAFERRKAQGFPRVSLPGWPDVGSFHSARIPESDRSAAPPSWIDRVQQGVAKILNPEPLALPRRNVAVCLPGESFHYAWLSHIFNIQGALGELGITSQVFLGYSSSAYITRMSIAEAVLDRWAADQSLPYVLWIDDDNLVGTDLIKRWISEFDARPEIDILVGWCWIQRGVEWSLSLATFGENEAKNQWITLADVFKGGTGIREFPNLASGFPCVMMRREVLEKLGPEAFIPLPDQGKYGYMGEDFSFFRRAYDAGCRTFLDPLGKVGHLKFLCQEPTLQVPANASQEAIEWREKINGRAVEAPKELNV